MVTKTFLDGLNPLDNVSIHAETAKGLEHLYSGTIYGISKGHRASWDFTKVVGVWQWGGTLNIVLADVDNAIKIPKRIYKAVCETQKQIAKKERAKTY